MIAQYIPYAMAAILMIAVAIDIRTARMPNWLTLLPVVLFIVQIVTAGDPSAYGWQLAQGAIVFVLGIGLFSVGGMGAGAVKLLAGTALLIPTANGWYALAGFLGVVFVLFPIIISLRKAFGSKDSKWAVMARQILPMSLPIAAAGLLGMFAG
ncbi:Type IV leader peptidase family protein [Yoonia tamlensis]|uniref:Type IV leader peptidase family protein n=1 Tax=Yoonia tamlensis TaxID=390270 RepID=A0A1I6G7I9_9RHOB|nr:prepilin peptidase [Yoonia tamlensis]SFR38017.1 Type IV leader peptidase family protein [Yoonia tamlensis]